MSYEKHCCLCEIWGIFLLTSYLKVTWNFCLHVSGERTGLTIILTYASIGIKKDFIEGLHNIIETVYNCKVFRNKCITVFSMKRTKRRTPIADKERFKENTQTGISKEPLFYHISKIQVVTIFAIQRYPWNEISRLKWIYHVTVVQYRCF